MKEETFRFLQISILCVSVFIIPGVILFVNRDRKSIKEELNLVKISEKLENHIFKCDKVSKEVIIEKLDHLTSKVEDFCDRLEEQKQEIKEIRKDFKEEIGFQRTRYHALDNTITKVLLKLHLEIKEDERSTTV